MLTKTEIDRCYKMVGICRNELSYKHLLTLTVEHIQVQKDWHINIYKNSVNQDYRFSVKDKYSIEIDAATGGGSRQEAQEYIIRFYVENNRVELIKTEKEETIQKLKKIIEELETEEQPF